MPIEIIYNSDGTTTTVNHPDPPAPPKSWDVYDFKLKFTPDERIALRTAAVTNPYVADFLDMLATVGLAGGRVHADAALLSLALTEMEQEGLLSAQRVSEILEA